MTRKKQEIIDKKPPKSENDLAAIVNDSKRSLADQKQVTKRGRPRKDATADPSSPQENSNAAPSTSQESFVIPTTPSPLRPLYEVAYKSLGLYAVTVTQCPEVNLSEEELQLLTTQTDICGQLFFPDGVNSKWGALASLSVSLAVVSSSKYMIYMDHLSKQLDAKNPPAVKHV